MLKAHISIYKNKIVVNICAVSVSESRKQIVFIINKNFEIMFRYCYIFTKLKALFNENLYYVSPIL